MLMPRELALQPVPRAHSKRSKQHTNKKGGFFILCTPHILTLADLQFHMKAGLCQRSTVLNPFITRLLSLCKLGRTGLPPKRRRKKHSDLISVKSEH
jgi:hypothetical protein